MPQVQQWELQNKIFEKKLNTIEKEFKKLCTPMDANAVKDAMKKNRKAAYDKEDKFVETIPAAIKKGITGKKWKDFVKDKDFDKAMKTWESALVFQQDLVKSLEMISDKSKKHFQDLKRAVDDFESDIKKSGEAVKTNKTLKKTFEKANSLLGEIDDAKVAFGKLPAKEAFFGANLKKSKDVVVSNALKAGQGDELPDILLETPKRKQSDVKAKRLNRNVSKFVDNATMLCAAEKFATIPEKGSAKTELEKDVQNAKASLKTASGHLKGLKDLNDQLQVAKKKQAKLIAAHNEGGKMSKFIEDVAKLYDSSEKSYNAAEDLMEEADSKL